MTARHYTNSQNSIISFRSPARKLDNPYCHIPRFSLTSWGQVKELFEGLYLILFCPRQLHILIWSIFKTCGGYLLVAIAFLFFVALNEGVVVGDRSAHQMVLHPTQLLYFCAFSLCFSAPYAISRLVLKINSLKWFLYLCRRELLYNNTSKVT